MVYYPWWVPEKECSSQKADPLNVHQKRTVRNSNKAVYNCAGYALGCFSWYCPRISDDYYFGFGSEQEAERKTAECVEVMLADFPSLRLVQTLEDVGPDEYAILFRLASDGDFHYLKRDSGNHWRHKMGDGSYIETMKTEFIFNEWLGRYNGPIVILAKKVGQ